MWYFTWVLGLTMAILLAVVNAMWFEAQQVQSNEIDLH
jgi:cyd operon protein YbgT